MPEYEYICPADGQRVVLTLPITDDIPESVLCECGEHAVRVYSTMQFVMRCRE